MGYCFSCRTSSKLVERPNVTTFNSLDITNEDELDPDVMDSMTSLGCFKDRQVLVEALMRFVVNFCK